MQDVAAMRHCRCGFLSVLPLLFLILIISGCAPKESVPISILHTPEHHVVTGMKLLESGKLLDAEREFNLAKELDPEYSPAFRGLGLVLAYKGDLKPAFDTMSHAQRLARTKQEEALVYVGLMRLYTRQKEEGWLEDVEENFERARMTLEDVPAMPDPYLYMGLAYKEAYRFSDAADAFRRVLEINETYTDQADQQLKLVQKIESAMPGTPIGKKVALLEKVKRVDVAALFIHELKLDAIYKEIRPGLSFKPPVEGAPIPVDVEDHALRADVQAVVDLGVKDLGVFPDGTFAPNDFVTRASYAIMISDIIATITDDPSLATKYRGHASPFADVRNDVPCFNAIMVCTTRGIIEPKRRVRQDIFDPAGPVSGADALLAIRRLKEDLGIF
jgi:tetratricopeptide (TPR) repeat protein